MEVPTNLQIGCRVQATTKDDVKIGKVAFVGLTSFAPGMAWSHLSVSISVFVVLLQKT